MLVTHFVGLQYVIVSESFCWSTACDCWWLILLVYSMWLLVTLFVGLQYMIVGDSFCWPTVGDCWWLILLVYSMLLLVTHFVGLQYVIVGDFLLVCSIWLLVTHFNQWVSHLSVLSPPPMEVIVRRCDVSLPLHKGLVWVMSHRWRCRAANSTAQCSTGTELSIWYSMSTIRGKIMGKGKGKPNAFRCTTHSICRGIRGVLVYHTLV
jgi:hypothetical protein